MSAEGEVEIKVRELGDEIFAKYNGDNKLINNENEPYIKKEHLREFIRDIMKECGELDAWSDEVGGLFNLPREMRITITVLGVINFDDELLAILQCDLVRISLGVDIKETKIGKFYTHIFSLFASFPTNVLSVDLVEARRQLVTMGSGDLPHIQLEAPAQCWNSMNT